MLNVISSDRQWIAIRGVTMRTKILAFFMVVAVSAGLFLVMHRENRADAAAGDCYSAAQGPNTPTICQ
jgi:hypothetical protein